ncbi:unnamed protein product [Penicillium salamii]|nr:unnamed protein product [Penicillium salamii]
MLSKHLPVQQNRFSFMGSYNLLRVGNRRVKVSPVGPKKCTTLWKIPPEIVETIFQLLSDLDRACFALSCKRFHDYYISYNKKHGISVLSTLHKTLILRRLQNQRWVYCIRCQNLHRRSRWKSMKCGWRFDPKPIFPTKPIVPAKPMVPTQPMVPKCKSWCDIQHDDKVDICPCASITFHQKQHHFQYFDFQKVNLKHSNYQKSSGWFTHTCVVEHPLAEVLIRTLACFNNSTKTFQVENRFTFKPIGEARSSSLFQNVTFKLSKYETESWLKRFFHEAGSDFFIGDACSNWYHCHGWKIGKDQLGETLNITIRRDLGGNRRPCKGWEGNCYN